MEGAAASCPQEHPGPQGGRAEPPAHGLEDGRPASEQQAEPGPDGRKKRRRRETEGGRQHSTCSPTDNSHPEGTEGSPKRKRRKRRKPESGQEAEQGLSPGGEKGPTPPTDPETVPPAVGRLGGHTGLTPDAAGSGPRARGLDVLQELLRYASDTAYGKKVLTWDGALSAVSQDAVRDSKLACATTVTDDWDAEFDRGKEKKPRKLKREKKRNFNAFQKLQSRRNFWSVTHPAKAASLSYRR